MEDTVYRKKKNKGERIRIKKKEKRRSQSTTIDWGSRGTSLGFCIILTVRKRKESFKK